MRKGLITLGVVGVIVGVAALVIVSRIGAVGTAEIDVASDEGQPIASALTKAYDVMAVMACQPETDLSLLESVFKDTPDYQASSEQRSQIARVLGPEVAERAGFLSLLKAYYQENRQPVADAAIAPDGGPYPTAKPILYCPDPTSRAELKFESIRRDGTKAVVRYDDGAALQVAVLVNSDGSWFVVSIRAEALHF